MSQLKLTADGGGGTVAIKGPASTTGNNAFELTVPGTASTTLDTLNRSGNILQVKSVVKSDTFSYAGQTAFVDVTGLSVAITPASANNKILVLYDLAWSTNSGHVSCRLLRDSTAIKIGDAAGSNRPRATGQMHYTSGDQYDIFQVAGTFLDSPSSTSSVTYKWQIGTPYSAAYNIYINRQAYEENGDQAYNGRTPSSITVMEVAA